MSGEEMGTHSLRVMLSNIISRQKFQPGFWALFTNHNYLPRYALLQFVKQIADQSGGLIIDVGCGSKPYQAILQHDKYVGVDIYNSAHPHENEDIDLIYDGAALPFANNAAQTIVCFEVLEHVADVDAFLAELRRVLEPGGRLILTTPFMWPEHEQPYDFRRLTSFGLRQVLETAIGPTVTYTKLVGGWAAWSALFNGLLARWWQRGPLPVRAVVWLALRPLIFLANIAGLAAHRLGRTRDHELFFGNAIIVEKRGD